MTALELERKLEGLCIRCGAVLADQDETNLCASHRLDLNARVATCVNRKRQELRRAELCVECAEPSKTYRCGCRRRRLVSTIDSPSAISEI